MNVETAVHVDDFAIEEVFAVKIGPLFTDASEA